MTGLQVALAVLLILISIIIIVIVLLQRDNNDASAIMGGGHDASFYDKTRGHHRDSTLALITKVLGVIFVVLALITLATILFM